MKFTIVCLLVVLTTSKKCIALIHGLGGTCEHLSYEQDSLYSHFRIETLCINFHEGEKSLRTEMDQQSAGALENLKKSRCKDVYLVAVSQGAVIANYIVAHQHGFRVKGLTTFGGVNRGIHSVQDSDNNTLMKIGNAFSWIIDLSFSSYIRDNRGKGFFSDAKFLRQNINDTKQPSLQTKENFLNMDKIILVGYSNENVFNPKETAYFLWADDKGNKLKFEDDPFFKLDKLGILEQFEKGKLEIYQVEGNHGEFDGDAAKVACSKMLHPNSKNDQPKSNMSRKELFEAFVKRVDQKVDINGEETDLPHESHPKQNYNFHSSKHQNLGMYDHQGNSYRHHRNEKFDTGLRSNLRSKHQPVHRTNQPVHRTNQPVHHINQPVHHINQPVHHPNQPVHHPNQPVHHPNQPVHHPNQPTYPNNSKAFHTNHHSSPLTLRFNNR